MIDWSVMTGEEVVAALRSIPVVMHPWQGWGGERLVFASGRFFSRHSVVEGHLVQGGTKRLRATSDAWAGMVVESRTARTRGDVRHGRRGNRGRGPRDA